MPQKIPPHKPRYLPTRKEQNRRYDVKRKTEKEWRKWYHTPLWRHLRRITLQRDPFCVRCKARGEVVPSTIANHIKKHQGDWLLFKDPDNLEGVCKPCHDGEIQSEERKR